MIINAHAHIYPDKIAERAVGGIEQFYNINVKYNGTVASLLRDCDEAGVSRVIVQSVATVPEQVNSINNFIAESSAAYPDKFIGFGTMHPDYPDISGEIERMISLGLKGIKIHSDFQQFNLDDERAFPIYEYAEGRLPILFHMGDTRYDFSAPERLLRVIKKFPKLTVIGAHFAGWSLWERAVSVLEGTGIYTDCSSSLYMISPEKAAELISRYGADRVLWGTDFPMWSSKEELERFDKIPLSETEKSLILSGNALRLLGENP